MESIAIPVDEQFCFQAKDVVKTATENKCNAVLLINPDNPSGHFFEKQDILYILDELKKIDCTLIFDESFIDFAEKEIRYTLIDEKILADYPNLIVVKSISKSYGVPGLRLGVLANGDETFIQKIKKTNSIWNINSFAEYFLQIFEKYKKAYIQSCDKIAEERKRFVLELSKVENGTLKVFKSQANYVMCRLPDNVSVSNLVLKLLDEYGIFIKDLNGKKGFEKGNYIRLAVKSTAENDELLQALKNIL